MRNVTKRGLPAYLGLVLLLVTGAACSRSDSWGAFSKQVTENTYFVEVGGATDIRAEHGYSAIEKRTIQEAAKITLENDASFFRILGKDTAPMQAYVGTYYLPTIEGSGYLKFYFEVFGRSALPEEKTGLIDAKALVGDWSTIQDVTLDINSLPPIPGIAKAPDYNPVK